MPRVIQQRKVNTNSTGRLCGVLAIIGMLVFLSESNNSSMIMEIGTFENIIYSATLKETSKSQRATTTTTKNNIGFSCSKFLAGRESDDGVWAPTSTHPSFTMSIHDPQKDAYISRDISKKGCFECDVLYAAMAALAQEPKSILIDVGGNIGMYSLASTR